MTSECNARVGIAPTPIGLDGIWEFGFEEDKSIEEVADPGFAATDAMAVPGCFDTLPKWFLKRGTALYRRDFTLPDRDQGASGIDVMARRSSHESSSGIRRPLSAKGRRVVESSKAAPERPESRVCAVQGSVVPCGRSTC